MSSTSAPLTVAAPKRRRPLQNRDRYSRFGEQGSGPGRRETGSFTFPANFNSRGRAQEVRVSTRQAGVSAPQWAGRALIASRALDVIDDQEFAWSLAGIEAKSELLGEGRQERLALGVACGAIA